VKLLPEVLFEYLQLFEYFTYSFSKNEIFSHFFIAIFIQITVQVFLLNIGLQLSHGDNFIFVFIKLFNFNSSILLFNEIIFHNVFLLFLMIKTSKLLYII